MKKWITIACVLTFILALVGCGSIGQQEETNNTQYYFSGKVIEVNEEYLLIEVNETGNSNLSDGVTVEVSTDVVAAAGCPEFVVDEYARVVMARNTENTPSARLDALSIYKTDETGMTIAD